MTTATKTTTKATIGRPPTGRTPDNERQSRSIEALRRGGGDKIAVRLPPDTNAGLRAIKSAKGLNTTEAVIAAIDSMAKRLR